MATLIQCLGRWGKATRSNDFSYFRMKPILGGRCPSVCLCIVNSSYMMGVFHLRGWENVPMSWSGSVSVGQEGTPA